jgi:hypothetical protein
MRLVLHKPGTERFSEDRIAALDELAADLSDLGHDVDRDYREQAPGQYGVTWWEVAYIYVGMKAIDAMTSRALDAAMDKIVETTKRWAHQRLNRKGNNRPEYFAILDAEGKVLRSWKIDKQGEEERTQEDRRSKLRNPPAPRDLAVVTREVVDSADGWPASEGGVGTVMVVAVDPGLQGSVAGGI